MKKSEKNIIIKQNTKIDKTLIENAESFEKKISKFGETIKPKYTLTQPFDTSESKLHNSNFYNLLTKAAMTHFPESNKKHD